MTPLLNIHTKAEILREEIGNRLGMHGATLEKALNRSGRLLPARVRRQAQVIVSAQQFRGHPKLERTLDGDRVEAAFEAVRDHLAQIDAADARRGRILTRLATIVFNLILVAVCFVTWMWWRGYV